MQVLCTLFFFCPYLSAQTLQIEQIPNELGLSQGLISCLLQDSRGFLWVGTKDGLNRFDGYQFKVYRNNPFDATSISDNFIKTIYEDRDGRLWVGTLNGLNLFDRQKDCFLQIHAGKATSQGLSHSEINGIIQTQNGDLWFATNGGGLNKLPYNQEGFKFSQIRQKDGLKKDIVGTVVEDGAGHLWVKMEELVQKITFDKHSNQYQFEEVTFSNFSQGWQEKAKQNRYHQEEKWYNEDKRIYALFKSQDGGIWFVTSPGFVKWNLSDGAFQYYPGNEVLADNLKVLEGTNFGSGFEDSKGLLWAYGLAGLAVFDPFTLTYLTALHARMPHLPDNFFPSISSVMQGSPGIVWIGTNGYGLYKCQPDKDRFSLLKLQESISGKNSVRSIFPYGKNQLLASTSDFGFYHLNRETKEVTSILGDEHYQNRKLLVYSVIRDHTDTFWVGARDGLFQLRQQDDQLFYTKILGSEEQTNLDWSPPINVYSVKEDRSGKLWLITSTQFGYFDRVNREFVAQRYLDPQFGNRNLSNFPCFLPADDGTFWLGTVDGLKHFDPNTQTFITYRNEPDNQNSLSHNVIRCILPDPKEEGILWIGTAGGGLNRFDIAKRQFQYFDIEDGLPDNVVYGILDDEMGQLWLSTNHGICRFNPQNHVTRNFDVSDGLQDNEFNSLAYAKADNGELFFGGINGLNAFFPEEVADNPFLPPVIITDFQLFNQSVNFKDPEGPLEKPISETAKIVLNCEDRVFSIQFAGLDFINPAKIKYAYKLEPFDEHWQYIGHQRSATFTNLDPGHYTFYVKSTNSDGIWNEAATSLKITIQPPWFMTFWALLLFALVFIGILFLFYRFNLSRQLEKREAQRLKELDSLKTDLYANITHEIRTPLTVILGMLEVFKDSQLPQHQRAVELIEQNGQDLMLLVNQILDLSKLEAGKMELKLVNSDIISYLQYLTESFHSTAELKGIDLHFNSELKELVLDFDEEKIQHIVNNLLSNALKFTPENGEIVLYVGEVIRQGKKNLKIVVKDSGIGISKEHLPHIFNRFYQADTSTFNNIGGTGIGLALTRELVHLMQGTIEVTSLEGKGSEFMTYLPIPAHVTAINLPSVRKYLGNQKKSDLTRKSPREAPEKANYSASVKGTELPLLLIIEDNGGVVAYLESCLATEYRLDVANNGEEGIQLALEKLPDIIICDVMMPRRNGFEVTQMLKSDERTSHIPIILLTARATTEDKLEGLQVGADAYLTKPFNKAELMIRLEKLVELRQTLQARYTHYSPDLSLASQTVSPDESFLIKIHKIVEREIGNPELNAKHLYEELHLSQAQLYRKIKALTGKTPAHYIRTVRLRKSIVLLQTTSLNISEIAYMLGFNDPNYFTRAFSKEMGMVPTAMRKEQEG